MCNGRSAELPEVDITDQRRSEVCIWHYNCSVVSITAFKCSSAPFIMLANPEIPNKSL